MPRRAPGRMRGWRGGCQGPLNRPQVIFVAIFCGRVLPSRRTGSLGAVRTSGQDGDVRLTIEEHGEAIKRYAHVKPAGGSRSRRCSVMCPGTKRSCTVSKGHRGPHVAHNRIRRVVAVWDSGGGAGASSQAAVTRTTPTGSRKGGRNAGPIGLRSERPVGVLDFLWSRFTRLISTADEFLFLILFIGFVVFVIQWTLLLLG